MRLVVDKHKVSRTRYAYINAHVDELSFQLRIKGSMEVRKMLAHNTSSSHHSSVMTEVFRFVTALRFRSKMSLTHPARSSHSLRSATINSGSLPLLSVGRRSVVRVERKGQLILFNIAQCNLFWPQYNTLLLSVVQFSKKSFPFAAKTTFSESFPLYKWRKQGYKSVCASTSNRVTPQNRELPHLPLRTSSTRIRRVP